MVTEVVDAGVSEGILQHGQRDGSANQGARFSDGECAFYVLHEYPLHDLENVFGCPEIVRNGVQHFPLGER